MSPNGLLPFTRTSCQPASPTAFQVMTQAFAIIPDAVLAVTRGAGVVGIGVVALQIDNVLEVVEVVDGIGLVSAAVAGVGRLEEEPVHAGAATDRVDAGASV